MTPYAEQSAGVLAPDPVSVEQGTTGGASRGRAWAVMVTSVPTQNPADADRLLATVRQTGLTGAYLSERAGRAVIAYGSYEDPGSPEAQAGLERVRSLEISGMRPFVAATLMPPSAAPVDPRAESYDLRGVRARRGESAVYTLQIGAYGRPDYQRPTSEELALFRRQAEDAVRRLRSEGEEAFFYHGPNLSSVTVGVFSEDDYDGSTMPPIESPVLRALRDRYPHNLLNGEGLRETIRTEGGPVKRMQPSRLVAIPAG